MTISAKRFGRLAAHPHRHPVVCRGGLSQPLSFRSESRAGIPRQAGLRIALGFNRLFGHGLYRLGRRLFPPEPGERVPHLTQLAEASDSSKSLWKAGSARPPNTASARTSACFSLRFAPVRLFSVPSPALGVHHGVYFLLQLLSGALDSYYTQLSNRWKTALRRVRTVTRAWEEHAATTPPVITLLTAFRAPVSGDLGCIRTVRQRLSAEYFWHRVKNADTIEIARPGMTGAFSRIRASAGRTLSRGIAPSRPARAVLVAGVRPEQHRGPFFRQPGRRAPGW